MVEKSKKISIPREIIDNSTDNKLVTFLNNILNDYPDSNLDIATAFFNITAYEMVKDSLGNSRHFRLLLGRAPQFAGTRTLGAMLLDLVKSEIEGFELSKNKEETVKALIAFLEKENVEVRLYDETFLHGKAYILDNAVVIGSSNFTAAGLTHNTELNSVTLEESKARYVREVWFEKFWETAKDFKPGLIELLRRSRYGSVEYSPYEIYIKALYELQKNELRAEAADIDEDTGRPKTKVNLAEFQQDAVYRAISRLEKFGSILVADSVGLGKTWIAKKVLEEIGYYERREFLVICPAQLRGMWRQEIKSINLPENILSQEELATEDFLTKAKKAVGGRLNEVELVVVDESHNFRNPLSNRWENFFTLIHEKISSNGIHPKMIFLTATPINNTIWDLYWQIMLLVSMNKQAFMKEGISDVFRFFKEIEAKGNPTLLNDLLNEISIRRTRDYIIKNYPNAYILRDKGSGESVEERIIFPKRILENINYELGKAYKGMYKDISVAITNQLTMAYYKILKYKKVEKLTTEESLTLGRMMALEGIYKTILLKRLESSVEAFRISVCTQIDFLEMLKENLHKGKFLTKQSFYKYIMKSDEELEEYVVKLESFNKSDYRLDELVADIDRDIYIFQSLLNKVKEIKAEEDAKLLAMRDNLKKLSPSGQIVVFTYYTDTLKYIFKFLSSCKELKGKIIQHISGATSTGSRSKIVSEFMDGEIDILLSSDVLSEGMNLQSAKFLINYDLHWNPTRMIQRAGRIDRIGSPYKEIFVYNFFPEDELEDLLRLVQILQNKIIDIDKSVGLDQSVLGEEIHPKVFGVIRKIKEKDDSVWDELEADAFGGGELFYQPLKDYLKTKALEDLEKLHDGIHSGLQKGRFSGIFFYYKYGEDFHFWSLYDLNTRAILTNKTEILNYIACPPEEKRVIPDFFETVYDINKKVIDHIWSICQDLEARQRTDSPLVELSRDRSTKIVGNIIREIEQEIDDRLEEFPEDQEVEKTWEPIKNKMLLVPYTKKRLKTLRKIWKQYRSEHDWRLLIERIAGFLADKDAEERKEIPPFDLNKLRLILIDFVS